MDKEVLELLKSINEDIKGLKKDIEELKLTSIKSNENFEKIENGQKRLENKLDSVVEQTADLIEFRTFVKSKFEDLKGVEEVTRVNCYDIAKLRTVK